jgi:geranylgeranyl diphosphate synthase, type III
MSNGHLCDDMVLEPMRYLESNPGKDVRGQLIDCFQQWLKIPDEKVDAVKGVVTDLHNASLLVDDIEDNSKLRRGMPVAHSIFGIPATLNCANYVYFLALEKCHSLKNDKALSIFVYELLNLHRGQGQDILWREQCNCPSMEQYRQMIQDKTGGLFRLAVGLLQSFSQNTTDYSHLVNLLAEYFQIRDDFLNISSCEYQQSKSYCEDLTEGKFSFPIIYSILKDKNDTRLLNILRQRTEDLEVKRYAVQYMKQCGALQHTREVLRDLHENIKTELIKLGGHNHLSKLLIKLDSQLDDDDILNQSDSIEQNGGMDKREAADTL